MQLHCPYCGHDIPAADVNLDRMVAKCASCSAVFGFEDQIEAAPATPRKLAVPLPRGIAQIFCKEHISRGKNSTTYQVHAATRDGAREKLVDSLDSSDQALYLEQEIERFLSIKDAPVAGEWRG